MVSVQIRIEGIPLPRRIHTHTLVSVLRILSACWEPSVFYHQLES